MSAAQPIDTHQKVLSINLDPHIFGSFAEIGGGQEVARWFLPSLLLPASERIESYTPLLRPSR
jgi:hypothetical protein